MSEPLVSILIPCYNCAAWVGKAIESALAQTWQHKEIIVIDDGSRDESWQIINSFVPAIQTEHQSNQGAFKTRNRLLALARGEWIQFLDADDELAPDKIKIQLQHRNQAEAMYGSMRLEWFEGRKLIRQSEIIANGEGDKWVKWFRWQYPNPSACLFRTDLVRQMDGWDPAYALCEDYALYKRLLFAGARFMATPDAWSSYRQWSPNQLVNKFSTELAETRLRLMLETAKKLKSEGHLTDERRGMFHVHAFRTVRSLYGASPQAAIQAISTLQNEAGLLRPPAGCVPVIYRFLYNLMGFEAAEKVAGWRRRLGFIKAT